MFDIIESSWSTEVVLTFDYEKEDEEAQSIFGQMQDLGYDSHSSILNLGSIALFSFVYYIKLAFYFLVLTPAAYLMTTKKYKFKLIRL